MGAKRRVAVIGAGPIGLEAALYAEALGHDVTVYEAGRVGEHVRRWQFVQLFSPWKMNVSPLGAEVLSHQGLRQPMPASCPTGREFLEDYLEPIAQHLGARLREECRVAGLGREAFLKSEGVGDAARAAAPFRLLLEGPGGEEEIASADWIIDASGVYGTPRALGVGGLPALGERSARLVDYHLPDLAGEARTRFEDRDVLLIGSGYSAATALLALRRIAESHPATRVVWLRKSAGAPLPLIDHDPLEERARLASQIHRLSTVPPPWLELLAGFQIEELTPVRRAASDGLRIRAVSPNGHRTRIFEVDRVLALVGYRPDLELTRELQVHLCYATEGPMKLAAALMGDDEGGGDCLTAGQNLGPDVLRNPERDYFCLGAKSYGRRSDFLLKKGLEQIRDAFRCLEGEATLDLYASPPADRPLGETVER